ncbi:MAG: DegT/DnrJ/EryC1/StrS family aminotransferase [Actinomycetota bacterium]
MSRARRAPEWIPLVDLHAQRARLEGRIEAAIQRVLVHGQFILGPEVGELEERLAAHCGVRHAVGASSGTDALLMALMAARIGSGDAVLVPSFTFPATAEVVALLGATPVFVDVCPDTGNVDPDRLVDGLAAAAAAGLVARALIAVDLFGQPADYDRVEPFCRDHELVLVVDAAQSLGATWRGRQVGGIGDVACTSFFPSKPLGGYGDGGAVLTHDDDVADSVRSLRAHGRGDHKYDIARVGINGRLDTIQAAILLEKLSVFEDELRARRAVADRYTEGLAGSVTVPVVRSGATSAWAQYTIQVSGRDGLVAALADRGIASAVYYPAPLHEQPAYRGCPRAAEHLPAAEHLAATVVSMPMHPYLDPTAQDRVIAAVRTVVSG